MCAMISECAVPSPLQLGGDGGDQGAPNALALIRLQDMQQHNLATLWPILVGLGSAQRKAPDLTRRRLGYASFTPRVPRPEQATTVPAFGYPQHHQASRSRPSRHTDPLPSASSAPPAFSFQEPGKLEITFGALCCPAVRRDLRRDRNDRWPKCLRLVH
jgi:hypothetical protein